MESKYSKFLTILLIVIIIGVIGLLGYLAFDYFKSENVDKEAAEYVQAFTDTSEEVIKPEDMVTTPQTNTSYEENTEVDPYQNEYYNEEAENTESSENTSTGDQTPSDPSSDKPSKPKPKKFKGFDVIGTIEIPKTKVEYPVLKQTSRKALEVAVSALYPQNPELNTKGNVVIIGHNYRNGKFFSNNKNLSEGDKIIITDLYKKEQTYIIYKKFVTDENDTSFYNRDTNGAKEITLSTCTDDSKARTIILARAQ